MLLVDPMELDKLLVRHLVKDPLSLPFLRNNLVKIPEREKVDLIPAWRYAGV